MKKHNLYTSARADKSSLGSFHAKSSLGQERQKRPGYPTLEHLNKNKSGNYRRLSQRIMHEERLEKLDYIRNYSHTRVDEDFSIPTEVWEVLVENLIIRDGRFRIKSTN